MKYKIIGDSCCDLTREDLKKEYFFSVPLTLMVGDKSILDNESFNQKSFYSLMESSPECPKSACPSPEAFMELYKGADVVYVVTLSDKLSGSYNSAITAKQIYLEENPYVDIHIFNSKTAAAGEHLICEKIEECVLKKMGFPDTVKEVEEFIEEQVTVFVLEDIEVLRKNGRLSKVKSIMANIMNVKPILCADNGEIVQLDKARGMSKALDKMLLYIEKGNYDKKRKVEITCCDCYERCMHVKKLLVDKLGFENVQILPAGGVSSMYGNRGGVIISF